MQQRALARARGADDGNLLSGIDAHVDAAQHVHIEFALAETLGQALGHQHRRAGARLVRGGRGGIGVQHGFTHSAAPPPG
jgi:hypothetical protein